MDTDQKHVWVTIKNIMRWIKVRNGRWAVVKIMHIIRRVQISENDVNFGLLKE